MIKLMDLLIESPASDDAHKRGLTSAGWGKWKTSSGEVVAKTEKGKLVLLKKANRGQQTTKEPNGKVLHKTATEKPPKDVGSVGPDQSGKAILKLYKNETAQLPFDNSDQNHTLRQTIKDLTIYAIMHPEKDPSRMVLSYESGVIPVVLHGLENKEKQKIVAGLKSYLGEVHKLANPHTNPMSRIELLAHVGHEESKKALKTIKLLESQGIKIHSVVTGYGGAKKLHKALVKSHQLKSITKAQNSKLAIAQNETWRNQMTNKELVSMSRFQEDWQHDSVWKKGSAYRKKIFSGINGAARKYKVPATGVSMVYRGMAMKSTSAAKFLSNFKTGQSVITPPSGYTSAYDRAIEFTGALYTGDEAPDHVIIFNMKSSAGDIRGIHFANEMVYSKYTKKRLVLSTSYGNEQEIVIPSIVAQTVVDMQTDMIQNVDDLGYVTYTFETNISLIQTPKMVKKTIYESSNQLERLRQYLLIKYMGGSVHGGGKPTKASDKNMKENSVIKLMDLLDEAFEDSVDIMGMIEFYKRAVGEERVEMERLIDDGDWKAVHDFIERTTKTHIVSFPQNTGWRASRKGAS